MLQLPRPSPFDVTRHAMSRTDCNHTPPPLHDGARGAAETRTKERTVALHDAIPACLGQRYFSRGITGMSVVTEHICFRVVKNR